MTNHQDRAARIAKEVEPFCESVIILSSTPTHYQIKVWRKVELPNSSLFSADETPVYPFDEWAVRQGQIKWLSGAKSRFWIGRLDDNVKITFIIER